MDTLGQETLKYHAHLVVGEEGAWLSPVLLLPQNKSKLDQAQVQTGGAKAPLHKGVAVDWGSSGSMVCRVWRWKAGTNKVDPRCQPISCERLTVEIGILQCINLRIHAKTEVFR